MECIKSVIGFFETRIVRRGCYEKYEYVNIEYSAKGVVFSYVEKHREIIDSYAEKGFRYVGFVPTEVGANGCIRKIDLIFEK